MKIFIANCTTKCYNKKEKGTIMPFCKFSSGYIIQDKTVVDNIFINDYLPYAPDCCIKVYLYGLSKCNNSSAPDNNIENFANVLGMTVEEVEKYFLYWQEQGLVQLLSTKPIEVRYLPISQGLNKIKKYNVDKYADFNIQMQELLPNHMVTPTEYSEYYNVIENEHIEPEALVMITKYCIDLKGENVRYPYIVTVAKNWAKEGVRTTQDVENKIQELDILDDKVHLVLNALGTKRKAQLEDVQMLNKWLEEFDFDLNVVIYVAKRFSIKSKIDMLYLNNLLLKYYEMKLNSIEEIENYETEKQALYDTAKTVVKNLGLYYEDVSKIVDTYVVKWNRMNYSKEILTVIADYSFKNSIRTLESFDGIVQKLYKLGITTLEALNDYLKDLMITDKKIAEILEKLGIKRNVNPYDRSFYKTWTETWNFDDSMLDYATTLSVGKSSAMQYMNKILSNWKSQNITTLDKAKATNLEIKEETKSQNTTISKEDINALFSNLEYVEV